MYSAKTKTNTQPQRQSSRCVVSSGKQGYNKKTTKQTGKSIKDALSKIKTTY